MTNSDPLMVEDNPAVVASDKPTIAVGRGSQERDAEHELRIESLAERMRAAVARYEEPPHAFSDLGEAHFWRMRWQEAIAARSPEQVARMLQAQAQRMAVEPGATRETV